MIHRNAELEALCDAASPDDAGPWQVYADWLVQRGDPRGEVANRFFLRGEAEAIAEFTRACGAPITALRHGFAYAAALAHAMHPAIAPTVRAVEVHDPDLLGDWSNALDDVATSAIAPRLRELRFEGSIPIGFRRRVPWSEYPQLAGLERLVIRGAFTGALGLLQHAGLRELAIRTDSFEQMRDLRDLRLPNLDRFELWLGGAFLGNPDRLFSVEAFPRLAHLTLGYFAPEQIDRLARSELVRRLRTVSFVHTRFPSQRLVDHAAAFAHLGRVDVTRCHMRDDAYAAVRAALANAV